MENKFTEKESINLILGMIENAKQNVKKGLGLYFLLWGYLVVLAGLVNFIFFGNRWASIGWLIMIPIGLLGNIIITRKNKQIAKVYTHADRFIGNVWLAFGISLCILLLPAFGLVAIPSGGFFMFYIAMLVVAGMAIFISGAIYSYKPLKFGAVICWACALGCFFVSWRYNILLYTIGFFFGYLVPGHMIIRKAK